MAKIPKRHRSGQRPRMPKTLAQFDKLPRRSQLAVECRARRYAHARGSFAQGRRCRIQRRSAHRRQAGRLGAEQDRGWPICGQAQRHTFSPAGRPGTGRSNRSWSTRVSPHRRSQSARLRSASSSPPATYKLRSWVRRRFSTPPAARFHSSPMRTNSRARATSECFPMRASTLGVADARTRSDRCLAAEDPSSAPRRPHGGLRVRRVASVRVDCRCEPPCCFRCERLAQGRSPYEFNHPFGKRNSPLTIRYPINDSRATLNVKDFDWTDRDPRKSDRRRTARRHSALSPDSTTMSGTCSQIASHLRRGSSASRAPRHDLRPGLASRS